MEISLDNIFFRGAETADFELIQEWFMRPHVCEFFDDPETGRSVPDLRKFISGQESFWKHWVGCYEGMPFMYLMTSEVKAAEDGIWGRWREHTGKTYSLDLFVGEEEFIGKGLSHQYIKKFITEVFPEASAFLIDPEVANKRAVHIYEKAGFQIVEEYAPGEGELAGVPHLMMKLVTKVPATKGS